MKAYSLDLRERVVRAVQSGRSREEVAASYEISLPTLRRWLILEAKGDLSPKPNHKKQPRLTPEEEPLLKAQVEAHPDAILDDHVILWEQSQGWIMSRATMARTLIRLGYTRKKRL
jgi:transposase